MAGTIRLRRGRARRRPARLRARRLRRRRPAPRRASRRLARHRQTCSSRRIPGLCSAFGPLLAAAARRPRLDALLTLRRRSTSTRSPTPRGAARPRRRAALARDGVAGEPMVDPRRSLPLRRPELRARRCRSRRQLDDRLRSDGVARFHALHHERLRLQLPGEPVELIHAQRDRARPERAARRRHAARASSAGAAGERRRRPLRRRRARDAASYRRAALAGRDNARRARGDRGGRLDDARPARPGAATCCQTAA